MSGTATIRPERIYVYANGAIAPAPAPGSLDTNTAIWTTAAPRARAATHSILSEGISTLLAAEGKADENARPPVLQNGLNVQNCECHEL